MNMYLVIPCMSVVSYLLLMALSTHSPETIDIVNYLTNKIEYCDMHNSNPDQTVFETFYDFTLYNQFVESMFRYYTRIEPVVEVALFTFLSSIFFSFIILIKFILMI